MGIKKLSAEHSFSVRFMILPVNTQWNRDDLIQSLFIQAFLFMILILMSGRQAQAMTVWHSFEFERAFIVVGQMLAGELIKSILEVH